MKKITKLGMAAAVLFCVLGLGSHTQAAMAAEETTIENGISIGNVNVGGMTENQAISAVEEYVDGLMDTTFTQKGETGSIQMTAEDMGVTADADTAVQEALAVGHAGSLINRYKTVVDKIADPLTHLVRNALDHGIETAEERLAAGKPAKGVLRLNAYHESGNVVIEVQDDGRGLNPERIRQKALEKGLLNANEQLDDQALYQLIFAPGFSTADSISNLSGRGVGMDVVKRSIDALRGSIELDSVLGKGCCVRIRLPLTLAIIDGFPVRRFSIFRWTSSRSSSHSNWPAAISCEICAMPRWISA
jgi:two-component system chemotaxis sensor kinase CheA